LAEQWELIELPTYISQNRNHYIKSSVGNGYVVPVGEADDNVGTFPLNLSGHDDPNYSWAADKNPDGTFTIRYLGRVSSAIGKVMTFDPQRQQWGGTPTVKFLAPNPGAGAAAGGQIQSWYIDEEFGKKKLQPKGTNLCAASEGITGSAIKLTRCEQKLANQQWEFIETN
jgi:hypothetical protein